MNDVFDGTREVLAALEGLYEAMPPTLRVMVLSWVMAVSVTQPMKFLLPLRWSADKRHMTAQIVAFVTACTTVLAFAPPELPMGLRGALGALMGIWAPSMYWLVIRTVEDRWPRLADVLSADVRGVLIGEPRGSQLPRPLPPTDAR